MSEVTVRALIDSKLVNDHRVDETEYADVLTQIQYGWISQEELDDANLVLAQASQDVAALGGPIELVARLILEAIEEGLVDPNSLDADLAEIVETVARYDCSTALSPDLQAARAAQSRLTNFAADHLPEKLAGWLQRVFQSPESQPGS